MTLQVDTACLGSWDVVLAEYPLDDVGHLLCRLHPFLRSRFLKQALKLLHRFCVHT